MRIAVCPGSFDPVTNGHLDVFTRASKIFDVLLVAVFQNPTKRPLFDMDERMTMLKMATENLPNVKVASHNGLLAEFMHENNSQIIVRGLRALTDFEYEFQRALLLKKIDPELETIFIMTSNEYSFVSSSGIKELAKFGGCIKGLVPKCVESDIIARIREK